MQQEQSTTGDAKLATGGIVAPGMGALAGLAGMVGWGMQSHPGDPPRPPAQQAQQPPDATTLPPPEADLTPPPQAAAPEESSGGLPAAFSLFMRDSESEIEAKTPDATSNRGTSPSPARACLLSMQCPASLVHATFALYAKSVWEGCHAAMVSPFQPVEANTVLKHGERPQFFTVKIHCVVCTLYGEGLMC